MKDTLRKKSGKAGSNSEFDATTQSGESSPNPWASENSSAINGDTISRQVSKASKPSDTTSPIRSTVSPPTEEKSQSPAPPASQLNVPLGEGAVDDPIKPTRRRKTITKTPHTFDLEADLMPVKPKEQPPPAPMEPPKPDTPVLKKKKRVTQAPAPDAPTISTANTSSPLQQSAPIQTSSQPIRLAPTSPVKQPPPVSSPVASPMASPVASPAPIKTTTATVTPVNPFTTHRPKKSLSVSSAPVAGSNPCRFTPPLLPQESFHGKVIVLTNGASLTGQSLIRQFHAAGCRIIFGDTNGDQARKFISSLPPPHVVHFNRCDMTRYSDMLELFKLATTMYGRVDHAIFGVGDDGGQTCTVGEAEKGWFEDRAGANKTFRMATSEIETEPSGLGDVLTASVRFARIAMAYLKYSPKSKSKKSLVNPYSKSQPDSSQPTPGKDDRSLTFVTSISAFKETPLLPIYQVAQHSILGLVRALRATVDPDPERDGVRINAVATNVMVPRALAQAGGRMSVQLPPDRPEDVARVVVGVVATNSSTSVASEAGSDTGITNGGGIWYEKGFERGMRERYLHGRIIYSVGVDCWDLQEGLDRSEAVWLGARPSEALARGMKGLTVGPGVGTAQGSSWILDLP